MKRGSERPIWGWNAPVRLVLIALAVMAILTLAWSAPGRARTPAPALSLRADPNRAPEAVLGALPGLGPTLSRRIVEGRSDGPFASIEEIDRRVKGIGPAKAGALAPFLRFEPAADVVPR